MKLLLACLFCASLLLAQTEPVITGADKIEIKGVIASVSLNPGEGMPVLTVKAGDGKEWKVWLGSIRYLIDHNFNPKAEQRVVVEAYELETKGEAVAASVTISDTNQTIKLRDEDGRPLWRGGRGARYRKGNR